jgi:HlyD family secretion protein
MRRYLVWLLPLPIVIGVAVFYATRDHAIQISQAAVTRGPISREVLTSGTLEPANIVDVGTQVSGTIQSLHADFNALVKAGQIVAELDPSVYDAELAEARARVIELQGEAQRAKVFDDDRRVKLDRARSLASQDLAPRTELDAAEIAAKQAAADLAAARAAVASARALLKQAQVNRDHTIIRSPIDGIVVSREVEVGQTLAARLESPVLFRIADLDRMRLLAEVGEAEVGGVARGSEVSFQIESLGPQKFQGRVVEVRLQPVLEQVVSTRGSTSSQTTAAATTGSRSSTTNQTAVPASNAARGSPSTATTAPTEPTQQPGTVVSYTAIVDVDNRDRRIAPGTTAIVELPTAERADAIKIPNGALTFRPSRELLEIAGQESLRVPQPASGAPNLPGRPGYVWKYEDRKFVPVEVRTGVSDETSTALVSGALAPGDQLVTSAAIGRSPRTR